MLLFLYLFFLLPLFFFFNYYFSGIVSREVWESETGLFLCYQDMFTQAPLMYVKHFIATLSFS